MDSAEQMRRLGEESQEAFASGNPETLDRTGDNMMQASVCALTVLASQDCVVSIAELPQQQSGPSLCMRALCIMSLQALSAALHTAILQAMLNEMEIVRNKVLAKPELLPELVDQLHFGETDMQTKAAEMLFCVVGQGPGRDAAATKQVSLLLVVTSVQYTSSQQACWHQVSIEMCRLITKQSC